MIVQANRPAEGADRFFGTRARQMSRAEKRAMIDPSHKHLSVVQQCGLLGLGRSSFYYQPVQDNAVDLVLMAAIDRQFLEALIGFRGDEKPLAW